MKLKVYHVKMFVVFNRLYEIVFAAFLSTSSSFLVRCRDVLYCVLVEFVGQLYIIFHLSYIFCCDWDRAMLRLWYGFVEGFVASELGFCCDWVRVMLWLSYRCVMTKLMLCCGWVTFMLWLSYCYVVTELFKHFVAELLL